MAHPSRNVDISQHSYTGGYFRQRLRNFVGFYVDAKLSSGTRGIAEPNTQARSVENQLTVDEQVISVETKEPSAVQGEEKLVLYPTYARVKPHLFHSTHRHTSTSEHGNSDVWAP